MLMYYDVTVSLFCFSVLPKTLSFFMERWVEKSEAAGEKEKAMARKGNIDEI